MFFSPSVQTDTDVLILTNFLLSLCEIKNLSMGIYSVQWSIFSKIISHAFLQTLLQCSCAGISGKITKTVFPSYNQNSIFLSPSLLPPHDIQLEPSATRQCDKQGTESAQSYAVVSTLITILFQKVTNCTKVFQLKVSQHCYHKMKHFMTNLAHKKE